MSDNVNTLQIIGNICRSVEKYQQPIVEITTQTFLEWLSVAKIAVTTLLSGRGRGDVRRRGRGHRRSDMSEYYYLLQL